ncbi:MAG: Omp28-related outer membrane protein [Ignavibacteriae bacterium]|nr:Omp28-related outer membrane protein [Ignavibacteriota bacterium]
MKKINVILILLFFISAKVFSSERKVLVEIFTNSHCPLCPPAHSAIDNYLQSSNGSKIEFIYYHMIFPYSTDKLYQDNTEDASAKNNLYGNFSSTPQAFFNGKHVSNSYGNWASTFDNLVSEEGSFNILLSGNYTETEFSINAKITKTADVVENDLVLNFIVVENVNYQGNNGISNHKNVMRKISDINGNPVNITLNETQEISATFNLDNLWNADELKIIAYLQSSSSKNVYQAESINYNELSLTNIDQKINVPFQFKLYQNYPNPFNPETKISYTIPNEDKINSPVQLRIFDSLGKVVKTLVNKKQSAGNHEIYFNANNLPSGIYFMQLTFGKYNETGKMILLK